MIIPNIFALTVPMDQPQIPIVIGSNSDDVNKLLQYGIVNIKTPQALAFIESIKQNNNQFRQELVNLKNDDDFFDLLGSRRGVYVKPNSKGKSKLLAETYEMMHSLAIEFWTTFCIMFPEKLSQQRKGLSPNDTLTTAVYEDKDDSIKWHTDFGMLSVAIADQDGFVAELHNHTHNYIVRGKAFHIYIHTGAWLAAILKITPLFHAGGTHKGSRLFLGFFLYPSPDRQIDCVSMITGNPVIEKRVYHTLQNLTFNDFITEYFKLIGNGKAV